MENNSDGYIRVQVLPNDFFASMRDCNGSVAEHRLIMAQHLSRCLLPWEIVQYKNGNRSDNRIDNLQLIADHRHLVDTGTKSYIRRLEAKIAKLEKQLCKLQVNKEV